MFDVDTVKKRLESFGYIVKNTDSWALNFCLEKVRMAILNDINQTEIPDHLNYFAVDWTVGEFLLAKKTFSPGDLDTLDLDIAIGQIKVGDTDVKFGTGNNGGSLTSEQRLDILISHLMTWGLAQLSCFRKLRW